MASTTAQHSISFKTTIPSDFNETVYLLFTLPSTKPTPESKNRIPITLFISDSPQAVTFGSYTYTIQAKKRGDIYQTVLNNSEEELLELNKKMARIICKKFGVPVYLNLNFVIDQFEVIAVIKATLDIIEKRFDSLEKIV